MSYCVRVRAALSLLRALAFGCWFLTLPDEESIVVLCLPTRSPHPCPLLAQHLHMIETVENAVVLWGGRGLLKNIEVQQVPCWLRPGVSLKASTILSLHLITKA